MLDHLPALICALLVALLLVAELREHATLKAVSKTGASLSFLAYAVTQGALEAGPAGWAVFAALVASAAGDVALLSRDKTWFLVGLGAFLVGHLLYVVAFGALGLRLTAAAGTLAALALPFALVWRWLEPRLSDRMRVPVIAYMVVISLMVAGAVGVAMGWPSDARIGLVVAAVAFYLSDLCVARDRFVARDPRNKLVGLPLYYGAQLGFAATVAPATVLIVQRVG